MNNWRKAVWKSREKKGKLEKGSGTVLSRRFKKHLFKGKRKTLGKKGKGTTTRVTGKAPDLFETRHSRGSFQTSKREKLSEEKPSIEGGRKKTTTTGGEREIE